MRGFLVAVFGIFLAFCGPAHAEFLISSAIIEFTADGPRQQDIDIVSRSKTDDYVVAETSEVIDPGTDHETRRLIDDPADSMLLVTPDKSILPGGGRKVLRFVLLKDPDDKEHIYRVAVKPVIKGVNNDSKVGLKVLVGYEVLVIVRPASMAPAYTAQRSGKLFNVTNTGNTNILFQNGKQCVAPGDCKLTPVMRVYPGGAAQLDLPQDAPVTFSIWNGKESIEQRFD